MAKETTSNHKSISYSAEFSFFIPHFLDGVFLLLLLRMAPVGGDIY